MTLFWTSFSFVAIYQHGYHGMEDWRSQVPPSAVDFRFLHPRPLASAALVAHCTYNVGVLYLFVWFSQLCPVCQPQKNQSHQQHHSACLQTYMGKYTKPPKKLLKKTWKQVVMVADWLRFPRVNYGGGLMDLDTNRHGIPIPQGWITPTTRNNPPTPFWIYPRTHQEANFVVICEMTDIKSPQCC